MISIPKHLANRANAQQSTGPKTPAGKAQSAANSRTHGLCSQEAIIVNEDREEFDTMHVEFLVDIDPHGELEQTLFAELITAAWKLRRARRMRITHASVETELCAGADSYTAILDDEVLQKSSNAWRATTRASSAPSTAHSKS